MTTTAEARAIDAKLDAVETAAQNADPELAAALRALASLLRPLVTEIHDPR